MEKIKKFFKEKELNKHFNASFDLLITAKKVFYLQIAGFFIILTGIFYFIYFQNNIINKLSERLKKRDVIILNSFGKLETKTIISKYEILKQFGILSFLTTLNYDNNSPEVTFNFLRIYASQDVYKNFVNNVIEDSKLQKKIYSTYVDYTKPITVKEIKKNKLYEVTIKGIQYVYTGLKNHSYKVTLKMILGFSDATLPENIFNIKILTYNLKVE